MSDESSNFLIAEAQLVLSQARKDKSERTKSLGQPIQLPGKALAISIRGNNAWIAENTTVVRKLDLESGKTHQLYKGHTGPVTALAFYEINGTEILITGSWDRTIKLWNTKTATLISSTEAHQDFVKALFVFPSLGLLVSGGSDKVVRFWDISTPDQPQPISSVGSISSHTRPVECLEGIATSPTSAVLCTADTMGVIKVWDLKKESGEYGRWRSALREELKHHRTRVNELLGGNNQLWTASADETVQIVPYSSTGEPPAGQPRGSIVHPLPVRAILPLELTSLQLPYLLTGSGDIIRVYDVSSLQEPELVREIDAHWHDVTAIRLWERKSTNESTTTIEPWIVSSSLDGTLRKWRLSELLSPPSITPETTQSATPEVQEAKKDDGSQFVMSEEEERELAELLDSD